MIIRNQTSSQRLQIVRSFRPHQERWIQKNPTAIFAATVVVAAAAAPIVFAHSIVVVAAAGAVVVVGGGFDVAVVDVDKVTYSETDDSDSDFGLGSD